jgi:hypothetical protein
MICKEKISPHLKIRSGMVGGNAEDGLLWYQFVTTRDGFDRFDEEQTQNRE